MTSPPNIPPAFPADSAVEADRRAFPDPTQDPRRAEPVAAGASGRVFHRIRPARGAERILMHYPAEPTENGLFAGIGRVLGTEGFPVPRILRADPGKRLVWLEDLGDRDLFGLRGDPQARAEAYRRAIETTARLQALPDDLFRRHGAETLPPFDEGLYEFEHRYFRRELLARLRPGGAPDRKTAGELRELAKRLPAEPARWVHRDYQSKNLLLDRDGRLRVVDFQGLRRGHPFYDPASLLADPYAELPAEERRAHFRFFCSLVGATAETGAFAAVCCQRLLQALGAFGRHGLGRDVAFFRERIPVGLRLLAESAEAVDLPGLAALATDLREEAVRRGLNTSAGRHWEDSPDS